MDWNQSVNLYCERCGSGLLAEPYNVFSNAGFLLAAAALGSMGCRQVHGSSQRRWAFIFAALIGLIGLGSTTFHLLARRWAEVLDVGFIALFIYTFIAAFLRRWLRLNAWQTCLGLIVYAGASVALGHSLPAAAWNGSIDYLPALLGLLAMGLFPLVSRRAGSAPYFTAALLFAISLGLRTRDRNWCTAWPAGTHWAWHLINAGVLFLVSRALVRAPDRAERSIGA